MAKGFWLLIGLRLTALALVATLVWHWRRVALGPALAGGLHAACYGALLVSFARTLRPGHMALITRLMLRARPEASAARIRYTRRATAAWALFFAAQLVASGVLFAFAPRAAWFRFITEGNAPLILAMFLGEFALRLWWFRGREAVTMGDTWRAVRGYRDR